ncbi:uncharacterized protein A4U43_C07F13890 [Asparagus officinalis]|uniref:Uncharacterized protein n=1 Tax=Asparagus officinalis TaxID=4686 RepID=A0A5P1EH09_ASPOF|nr:uncharacterized protein A4U43_C07F13890 [Asparagus officinalis]
MKRTRQKVDDSGLWRSQIDDLRVGCNSHSLVLSTSHYFAKTCNQSLGLYIVISWPVANAKALLSALVSVVGLVMKLVSAQTIELVSILNVVAWPLVSVLNFQLTFGFSLVSVVAWPLVSVVCLAFGLWFQLLLGLWFQL